MERIDFFKQLFLGSLGLGSSIRKWEYAQAPVKRDHVRNFKTSLNAYSFNSYLQEGKMNLNDLITIVQL